MTISPKMKSRRGQMPISCGTLEILFIMFSMAYQTQAFSSVPACLLQNNDKRIRVGKPSHHHRNSKNTISPLIGVSSFLALSSLPSSEVPKIDFQSDESLYGRGEMHLSALLKEGDTVVYQTGTWDIDGIEVGDGSPATIRYATVIDIQLVWTHNCEHGVIRALDMELLPNDEDGNHHHQRLAVSTPLKDVEFGPDQLIARIPIEWDDVDRDFYSYQGGEGGTPLVALPNELITIE